MTKKNPHAVALGRRGGAKGGYARAQKLSTEELSEHGKKAAAARWAHPRATHSGDMTIGNLILPCHVLDTGQRVLSLNGMIAAMDMKKGSNPKAEGGDRLARFVGGKAVSPYIPDDLKPVIQKPLKFFLKNSPVVAYGYEAPVLVEVCRSVLKAKRDGKLQAQQEHIADRCEILIHGFAMVGIIALVDEATGYQVDRARNALSKILEAYIAKELAVWVKTFPDEFYREMFRLRGIEKELLNGQLPRPKYFGRLTNDIVYDRLAPGVREDLAKKNPKNEQGKRTSRHHQWLTREIGHPKLLAHLTMVIALMRLSSDWDNFIEKLDRVAARFGETMMLPFPDDDRDDVLLLN